MNTYFLLVTIPDTKVTKLHKANSYLVVITSVYSCMYESVRVPVCTYGSDLCKWLCLPMHIRVCIYGCESVILCMNMCIII